MINTEQLSEIIDDLKHVAPSVGIEAIFHEACTYQRGMMVNNNNKKTNFKPMTEKQKVHIEKNKDRLTKMGINVDKIKSIEEAKIVLAELWKQNESSNKENL